MSANSKPTLTRVAPGQFGGDVGRGVRTSAGSLPVGRTTPQFFEEEEQEGESHEAVGWQDTVLPNDDDTDRHVSIRSFDKIPRQKSAMLVLAVLSACLITGVGLGIRALAKTGWKVDASSAAFSRSSAPATSGTPAELGATGIAASVPTSPPVLPDVWVAKPNSGKPASRGTVENAAGGDAVRETGDRGPNDTRAKRITKSLGQTPRKYQELLGKRERSKTTTSEDDLKQEANPATSAGVVEPSPLKNPAHIEPPRRLSAPPEHPAPIVPSSIDPFEL